jgi:pre-mRNA-splicing factor ATP-dependent RNA helicase DHX16
MSSASQHLLWISDQLHTVLGHSSTALSEFVLSLSRKSATPEGLLGKLMEQGGMERTERLERFVRECHERVPPAGAAASSSGASSSAGTIAKKSNPAAVAAEAAHRANLAELKKAQKYALIQDDDEAMLPASSTAAAAASSGKPSSKASKKESKKERKAEKKLKREQRRQKAKMEDSSSSSSSSDSDSDDGRNRGRSAAAASSSTSDGAASSAASAPLSAEEQAELQRLQDQAEKKAFEDRLHQREEERTKRLKGEDGGKVKKEKGITEEELKGMIPEIREKARQIYLANREKQQLEFLRRTVEDEQFLFDEKELSKEERHQLRKRKRVLELTDARSKLQQETVGAYHMPSSGLTETGKLDRQSKMDLLTKRYVEETKGKTEQQVWEEEQQSKAVAKYGAAKRSGAGSGAGGAPGEEEQKEYDFVYEDAIDFVKQDIIAALEQPDQSSRAGDGDADGDARMTAEEEEQKAHLSEWEQIQVSRKKLPIYPYKEELMAAIEKYQVLIIVAETGSGSDAGTDLHATCRV